MIAVVLFTFDRMECARRTLEALAVHLRSPEPIWLHIADDGSSRSYHDELSTLGHELYGENVSISNSERRGYGGSYNLAMQTAHAVADLVLPLEDDWELLREFDVSPIVEVLREGIFGCVRLGYIGYTQELRARFIYAAGLQWLELDPGSPEPHVFAGGPRLETVEFERSVGPWAEGLAAGATEFEVAHRPASRQKVAWPIDLVKPKGDLFAHIGTKELGELVPGSEVRV